jgi:hypothetical protein
MKPFRDETELGAALRALRPAPRPQFAAELDARAAAGFPRESAWAAAVARVRERLASTPPRRLLAPAAAVALSAVAIATAVVATTDSGNPTGTDRTGVDRQSSNLLGYTNRFDGAGSGPAPVPEAAPAPSAAGGSASAGTAYSAESATGADAIARSPGSPGTGPYASQAGRRQIERSAEIVLGTEPAEVRAGAAKVFDAVHAAGGIVLSSSIHDGDAGVAGADFELLIPSARLSDALASLSSIADVRSRHEATKDITAPIVSVGERLQDSRAKVESLLGQLADAGTDEERAAVEAELRSERYRVAALRSRLSTLERRANFSRVSLRIETGDASSREDGAGGAWGIGDGIDGAGRILAVAAGVTVIGLAILAPFALIALLVWLSRRAWLRRARRDALSRA